MTEPPSPPPGAPPPPAAPPAAPPPADPPGEPADPPAPTAEEIIRNPQALLDILAAERDTNRRQARRLKDYERAQREREDAAKTELERERDEKAALQRQLDAIEYERRQTRIMSELYPGDPRALTLASRLRGATDEEMRADAAKLGEELGLGTAGGRRPPVDFGSGSRPPANGGQAPSGSGAFDQVLRRAAGRS
jgi:hypothetical protein